MISIYLNNMKNDKNKILIRFSLNKNYLVCKNIKARVNSNRQVIGDKIGIIYLIKYIIMSSLIVLDFT